MPKPSLDDVVVLLPGILGSVLRREGKIVWGYSPKTLATALLTGGESLRDALFLDHDSGDWEEDPGDIEATHLMPDLHLLPSLWKIDGYSGIENFLGERFDLKGGDDYFSFPYDWRRDNRINARRLKRSVEGWLREKRRSRPNAKLIFLAHSMGGLVARYYLEVLGGWRETRALVTFGTPFAGSVNALDALSGGVRKGPLHLSALTEMARSFPSVYQLLPTYKVLDLGDGELKRLGESEGLPNLCPRRLNDAVGFHREIREAAASREEQGYDLFPVVGLDQPTFLSARWHGTELEMLQTLGGKDSSGDGTVPRVSAALPEARKQAIFAATRHAALQNAGGVLSHVAGLMSGFDLDAELYLSSAPRTISFQVEDLYWSNEPIEVRGSVNGGNESAQPELRAIVIGAGGETLVQMDLEADPSVEGGFRRRLPTLEPGTYQLRIEGTGVEPAGDSFAVAGVTEPP